jgi:hypothetical protein
MSLGDWLLAALLLTSPNPVELQDPGALRDHFHAIRWPLLSLAIDYEILDPREMRYVLARPDDVLSDIQMLRRRYEELADAPPLADSYRFPDRGVVNEMLVFNRSFRKYLEERQPLEQVRSAELRAVQQETDQLYQVWDSVRDARCEYYYVTVRRQALKRLRDLVGEERYFHGKLPPHVPLWRFEAIP